MTFSMKIVYSYDRNKEEGFMDWVKLIHSMKLEDDAAIEKVDEWMKSISNSLVIISIVVKSITFSSVTSCMLLLIMKKGNGITNI